MPGYTASHSACKKTTNLRAKFYGKTALNGEIPVNKYQNNINHDVYSTKELKLRVRLSSIFRSIVGEFALDEDRTLHGLDFGFLSIFFSWKTFWPKFELLNSGCGLSTSAAYLRVFTVYQSGHCWFCSIYVKLPESEDPKTWGLLSLSLIILEGPYFFSFSLIISTNINKLHLIFLQKKAP